METAMAVSVRMNPLIEKELELAARRRGITKSQFIIDAVERALGRKDPAALYLKVMAEAEQSKLPEHMLEDEDLPADKRALRRMLRAKHERDQKDYAAYLEQREAARTAGERAAD
jgi:RHH-type rel operon transcriptional repressor/antitoxin RelB